MILIVLIFATTLMLLWFILMNMVTNEDWISAAYNKVLDNLEKINKLKLKDDNNTKKLEEYNGVVKSIMKLFLVVSSKKEIAKLEKNNQELQSGNLKSLSILIMPGYVLIRKLNNINKGNIYKKVFLTYFELYGKKHAENKTKQLMAKMLSYPIIGVSVTLLLGAIMFGFDNAQLAMIVIGIGTILVLVLVYAMYDELSDQASKRREKIAREFPNMVSKLALLASSGMIMSRAWKETGYSQNTELYKEMQKTAEELDNLVSPEIAYGAFISRCNTKETAKLASAIIQNLSKGNADIAILLKEMAKEAWLERRHMAKRESEKANSKLMIPTMLLFLAILIMIMMPIMSSIQA